ncbi:MAG: NADH-quinone oxidoreductase subunit K [Candidatus Nitrotoga sp.]
MSYVFLYALLGVGLLVLGLYALIVHTHLLRKILAINVMGTGVFLVLVALAARNQDAPPDPVPHAMVITGIVVAVSATALALILMLKVRAATGNNELSDRD